MKFRILPAVVLALASVFTAHVHADTASSAFSVDVILTPTCVRDTTSGTRLNFENYTAFGSASIAVPTVAIKFKCTRGLSPGSIGFDTVTGAASSSAAGSTATAIGVVAGMQYSLSAPAAVKTAGTVASATTPGTPDMFTYNITGTMASGQAGCVGVTGGTSTEVANCAGTQARTLTVSF